MKKLVLFAAVAFAVSFAACSSKTEEAKATEETKKSEFVQSAEQTAVKDGESVITIDGEETASEQTPATVNETVVE